MKRWAAPWGLKVKWFKHYSGALGSESLADLMRTDGLEGYARYWILLEHLAGLFDGESTSFRIPRETIRGLFRIRSWTELDSFADRLTTIRGLNVKRNENVFEIEAPILLDLLGRDFRVTRQHRAETAPQKKIKNKTKIKSISPAFADSVFEDLYALYPKKVGKAKGISKLKALLKDQADIEKFRTAIERYKAIAKRDGTEPRFLLHFSTFVNSRWTDYLDENVGHAEDFSQSTELSVERILEIGRGGKNAAM